MFRLFINLNFKIFAPKKSKPRFDKHIVRKCSPSPRSESLPLHISMVSWTLLTGTLELFRGLSIRGDFGGAGGPDDGEGATLMGTDSTVLFAVKRCPSEKNTSLLNFFLKK